MPYVDKILGYRVHQGPVAAAWLDWRIRVGTGQVIRGQYGHQMPHVPTVSFWGPVDDRDMSIACMEQLVVERAWLEWFLPDQLAIKVDTPAGKQLARAVSSPLCAEFLRRVWSLQLVWANETSVAARTLHIVRDTGEIVVDSGVRWLSWWDGAYGTTPETKH